MSDLISRQAAIDAVNETIAQYIPYLTRKTNGIPLEVALAIKRLPSAQPEPQWISCSERLPQQGQEVICQCRANMIKVLKLDACGDWYQDANHCYMSGFVIAWMPMPKPYERKEE